MGREFHVSPSINEAYYVVEDQRFLRGRGIWRERLRRKKNGRKVRSKRLSRDCLAIGIAPEVLGDFGTAGEGCSGAVLESKQGLHDASRGSVHDL